MITETNPENLTNEELEKRLVMLEEAIQILLHWKNKGLARKFLDKYNIPYPED